MNLERLFSIFRISGSGLSAQRKYLEATASNIANIETMEAETGRPYVPRRVRFKESRIGNAFGRVFRTEMIRLNGLSDGQWSKTIPIGRDRQKSIGSGVDALELLDDKNPFKTVYEPDNPNADANGYVQKPNINLVKEMTNMMIASRAYEANVTVMNAAKNMMKKALEI
jgi:flagellar basal-body rod protein FlgC